MSDTEALLRNAMTETSLQTIGHYPAEEWQEALDQNYILRISMMEEEIEADVIVVTQALTVVT